ncbi:telomere length regulation protein TEL2 homolog isoform X2 [Scyliorhinus canicula]|nr:telomere length regulation protein TEL2 homolog isoform X2 [Scyliorhinus canicula]XP_038676130.1 telomere length regulation protein TEL2 homolog isoform X2 [Scyliorhinus canicula]XP_038676131.1 telomere length regulation protein TEL2 homolog isoform X2 [Scyliorhinus canicula]XP_038676132.1 telomere length regulation protein TEL2 homolog isoform X2 [Scyliorhinus canicula]
MEPEILEVRCLVKQAIGTLSSSRDSAEITRSLQTMKQYLGGPNSAEHLPKNNEFVNTHYFHFLQVLTSNLSVDWLMLLPADQEKELLDYFFLNGPPHQAYLVLLDTIIAASPSLRQERCVQILEQFLREGRMAQLIWEVCLEHTSPHMASLRETLLNKISALPDHMANKLEKNNRVMFYPEDYYPLLGQEMLSVLERTCERLKGGMDCSLSFVSQLLGKVCIQGHTDAVLQVLVPRLTVLTQSDCIWQRISWRLVENVPERWMENVVSGMVRLAAGPEVLSRLLGSIVLKNKKAEFVLTHKFLLLQYQHKVCAVMGERGGSEQGVGGKGLVRNSVLQSLLGYLAGEKTRGCLLVEVLKKLLETWGNSSALRHTPIQQQLYISKAIVICLAQLTNSQIQEHKAVLLSGMMAGMECHLDSNIARVRQLGMVVAECLSARLNSEDHRLKFQYVEDDELRELRSLSIPRPLSSWEAPPQQHRDGDSQMESRPNLVESKQPVQRTQDTESESELDSDDELIPYDLSIDTELQRSQAPAYVSDCVEVLRASAHPEQIETTLKIVEDLIRKNPTASREVSVQFAQVLLHLEDKFNISGFIGLRQRGLVAITVTDIIPVTQYLTAEFYAVNYSLAQRLDILDVLALTAQELSQPDSSRRAANETPSIQLLREASDPHNPSQQWKKIIEERIENKTRRFAKGTSRPEAKAVPNRLGPVAGHFFFPLIGNYDRPQSPFDFLAEQPLMMGRLIHTLAILMYFSVNVPIAIHMGKALLDFTWAVRYHKDTYVRQGTLFAVSSILLSVPSHILLTEVPDELLEMRSWLADVAENDPDEGCRKSALQSLLLLENFKKKLGLFAE